MSGGVGKVPTLLPPPPALSTSPTGDGDNSTVHSKRKNPLSRIFFRGGIGGVKKATTTTSSPKAHVPISVAAAEQRRSGAKGGGGGGGNLSSGGGGAGGAAASAAATAKLPPTAAAAVVSPADKMKKATAALKVTTTTTTTTTAATATTNTKKRPWLTRTAMFRDMLDSAFAAVDADGSGHVDEKELYSGLLLIHLKLGTYAGPAACKPISRERCHDVFIKMDADNSGSLDREEFDGVMVVLFGNVLLRVLFQYACTLMVVPLVAQLMLGGMARMVKVAHQFLTTLDERSEMADTVEVGLEHVWGYVTTLVNSLTPELLQRLGGVLSRSIQAVPSSVWNTLPLTILSTVLSLMIIPWSLMKIDDFFQSLADRANKKDKEE